MKKLSEYMRVKEAAEFLGTCPSTLRTWGNDGKIKMRRCPFSGYRLFEREELELILEKINEDTDRSKDSTK